LRYRRVKDERMKYLVVLLALLVMGGCSWLPILEQGEVLDGKVQDLSGDMDDLKNLGVGGAIAAGGYVAVKYGLRTLGPIGHALAGLLSLIVRRRKKEEEDG
jgi:hypothetical protein